MVSLRIQLIHRSSLRALQKETLYWKRFFRKFTLFLYRDKDHYDQYVSSIYKTIKTFFNYLMNEKGLPVGYFHKQFKIPPESLLPIILEPYQLKHLILDETFHSSLPKNLQRSKDIFVFGCTVGLRFSDLMKLKKQNLQHTSAGTFIALATGKTATEVTIPLPEYVINIIKKYDRKRGNYLLPRLSNTNLNLQVKSIIEKAGWVHNLVKIRHKQGKAIEIKNKYGLCYRFCDHITTHTMRRTAITTLLIMGVPEILVRKISGHAAGSKEFYKYVAVVQDYLNDTVRGAFHKLINEKTTQNIVT